MKVQDLPLNHDKESTVETSRLMGSGNTGVASGFTAQARQASGNGAYQQIRLVRSDDSGTSCHAEFSARHPWLRNLLYFGPAIGAVAGGIARAAIVPNEPLTYCGLLAFGTFWLAGSYVHLLADRSYAERRYGEFHYC
ncbi:hypothetical protein L602_000900001290 [Cupriavidus gilardii J11]|uniref:Uncharacterized protein n=1 Tax=Cupriavidus gilardii J11 TaxID=936133 RepID=A0A562B0X3_9BURK|nr:hypothetical protein L602_000900001290 [Cupriavidus gilardii J11]